MKKIYILTQVNAWCELLYIQAFTSKEKAQEVMKSQVESQNEWYEPDEVKFEIEDTEAYWDDGEYDDRVKYSWNITEMEV